MSQNNSNEKNAMLSVIGTLNAVEGFDPAQFAEDYYDLETGKTVKKLPVIIQMAWFRLKYPMGKIAVQVKPANECFVASAKIYADCKDPIECYLAEATASRSYSEQKPSVSPREWAQTAAVGIALRNAGFGLQFAIAGESFEEKAPDELHPTSKLPEQSEQTEYEPDSDDGSADPEPAMHAQSEPVAEKVLTPEQMLAKAMSMPCPIAKFNGKTLGDVLTLDPKAIHWIATKFPGDEIRTAAKLICEYAVQQSA